MPRLMRSEPAGRAAAAAGLWRDPAPSTSTEWSTTQQVRAVATKLLWMWFWNVSPVIITTNYLWTIKNREKMEKCSVLSPVTLNYCGQKCDSHCYFLLRQSSCWWSVSHNCSSCWNSWITMNTCWLHVHHQALSLLLFLSAIFVLCLVVLFSKSKKN